MCPITPDNIVEVLSVLSPGITAVLTAIFSYKYTHNKDERDYNIRKLEIYCAQRLNAYNKFVASYGELSCFGSGHNWREFTSAANQAALVSSPEARDKIHKIVDILSHNGGHVNDETDTLLHECMDMYNQEYLKELPDNASKKNKRKPKN